jgi:hypothetical protein
MFQKSFTPFLTPFILCVRITNVDPIGNCRTGSRHTNKRGLRYKVRTFCCFLRSLRVGLAVPKIGLGAQAVCNKDAVLRLLYASRVDRFCSCRLEAGQGVNMREKGGPKTWRIHGYTSHQHRSDGFHVRWGVVAESATKCHSLCKTEGIMKYSAITNQVLKGTFRL